MSPKFAFFPQNALTAGRRMAVKIREEHVAGSVSGCRVDFVSSGPACINDSSTLPCCQPRSCSLMRCTLKKGVGGPERSLELPRTPQQVCGRAQQSPGPHSGTPADRTALWKTSRALGQEEEGGGAPRLP